VWHEFSKLIMKSKPREFSVLIERDTEGYFVATVPALRGCHTQAKSMDQLMERVREAIELCLEVESEPVLPGHFVGVQRVTVWAMPKLPRRTGREVIKILQEHDFVVDRIKGSHHFVKHPDGRCTVVPVHAGETLGPGLLLQILKDTELEKSDLWWLRESADKQTRNQVTRHSYWKAEKLKHWKAEMAEEEL
jgi:predicted RNA binding protein YcfA (HicA-like mRNA interferase family)/predicted RNase H-like HicB family nuclease